MSQSDDHRKLTGEEIRADFIGGSYSWSDLTGTESGNETFNADGTCTSSGEDGVWRVDGDRLCIRYSLRTGGKWDCNDVHETGEPSFRLGGWRYIRQ